MLEVVECATKEARTSNESMEDWFIPIVFRPLIGVDVNVIIGDWGIVDFLSNRTPQAIPLVVINS